MSIVSLEEVKEYLRVDLDDDNNMIQTLINATLAYIRASVTDFDVKKNSEDFVSEAKILVFLIVSELYDKRQFSKNIKDDQVSFVARSMIMHLEYGDYYD